MTTSALPPGYTYASGGFSHSRGPAGGVDVDVGVGVIAGGVNVCVAVDVGVGVIGGGVNVCVDVDVGVGVIGGGVNVCVAVDVGVGVSVTSRHVTIPSCVS
jgi:hypothetical protein